MRAIDAELPTSDGVAWFNKLYLRVTERVKESSEQGAFQSPGFLERLDASRADGSAAAPDELLGRRPSVQSGTS